MVKKIDGVVAVCVLMSTVLAAGLFGQQDQPRFFVTADQCMACHNGLVTPSGEEVSIGLSWRSSMMANSSRDPYWQGAVRREILDHPEARDTIENDCSICHMSMAHYQARAGGDKSQVFSHLPVGNRERYVDRLAADGASCTMCHQITDEGLGSKESFTGGFQIDTSPESSQRKIFGPFEIDAGRQRIMQSASGYQPHKAEHLEGAELCATCHTLFTHTLGPGGEVLGELPEQVPYLEWKHSFYFNVRPCQSCHMQSVEEEMPISSVLGKPREGFSRHAFRGGNFLMPRIFNRHRDQLGVVALPQEFESTARQTLERLATESARISISSVKIHEQHLEASLQIENLTGHKLPTAYPSRRVWIHFAVTDGGGKLVFESGGLEMDGSIRGNDNDSDPKLYERHHSRIASPDDVQVYEAIMADYQGNVTTGLLSGLRFVKDNRLLPKGFDKATADENVAVQGHAASDGNFRAEGDRIEYRVMLGRSGGPYTIEAKLLYQPISFRWARNLSAYDAEEPKRFGSFYESMAHSSAALLARVQTVVEE